LWTDHFPSKNSTLKYEVFCLFGFSVRLLKKGEKIQFDKTLYLFFFCSTNYLRPVEHSVANISKSRDFTNRQINNEHVCDGFHVWVFQNNNNHKQIAYYAQHEHKRRKYDDKKLKQIKINCICSCFRLQEQR